MWNGIDSGGRRKWRGKETKWKYVKRKKKGSRREIIEVEEDEGREKG